MKRTKKNHSKLFEEIVLKSWWIIVFFLICLFAYDRGAQRLSNEELKLTKRVEALVQQKKEALELQEELKSQIASHDDAAWIELVLMRRLGLVAEGQKKIVFS